MSRVHPSTSCCNQSPKLTHDHQSTQKVAKITFDARDLAQFIAFDIGFTMAVMPRLCKRAVGPF
eukprot:2192165-Pleurochrysis_carterae.AAC.2